jgi:hypothetical protein
MASLRHALNQASFSQEKQTVEELGIYIFGTDISTFKVLYPSQAE